MKQFELLKERNEAVAERLELVMVRVKEIAANQEVKAPFADYYAIVAKRLLFLNDLNTRVQAGEILKISMEDGKKLNDDLYAEIRDSYETSYANPAYAVDLLGDKYGQLFAAVYSNLFTKAEKLVQGFGDYLCIYAELLVELYTELLDEECSYENLKEVYYWFIHDYAEVFSEDVIDGFCNTEMDYKYEIIMNADLEDLSYLYRYGMHVTQNEIGIADFLNKLPQEEIDAMAKTYTEGYRIGFEVTNKSLKGKTIVDIYYNIGFERMLRSAIKNFEAMGLHPVFRQTESTESNHQFTYDHKDDKGICFDKKQCEHGLETDKNAFEKRKDKIAGYAGPAVIEVFGEDPFAPAEKKENVQLDDKQQELWVKYQNEFMQLYYTYIDGENRSFTIISYPIPEIGPKFTEIFAETVKINTLDYMLYRDIQQHIIDVLDKGEKAHILGANGNKTDLYVSLYPLTDPSKQTIFENCVADVNIPVGEVFTSPVLKGTTGKLHVSQVFLNGLNYMNLEIDFVDGMIKDYTCTNFDNEADNKSYIKKNLLFSHETLALGEFAIGTNTTAYKMARDFDIAAKMPILIAEKTGPHFAVGDTCYTFSEDTPVFNPDGKEIIARDNEVSALRNTEPDKAYFNCHTDITIPYDELASIAVCKPDGSEELIIKDGRFVVPGTEELNKPLDAMMK